MSMKKNSDGGFLESSAAVARTSTFGEMPMAG